LAPQTDPRLQHLDEVVEILDERLEPLEPLRVRQRLPHTTAPLAEPDEIAHGDPSPATTPELRDCTAGPGAARNVQNAEDGGCSPPGRDHDTERGRRATDPERAVKRTRC